jgi:acyl-CoA thioester hydrolase
MKQYATIIRVRYSEIDKMDIAHNATYLHWFELGRTELMRELGFTYRQLEDSGVMLPVAEAYCRFIRPAHYDEEIKILTVIEEVRSRTLRLGCQIRRVSDDTLLSRGHTVHVCVDIATGATSALPADFRRLALAGMA